MLLFPLCELCHFLTSDSMKMLWQWVPCERNSSYNFILILLKLCTCFRHGLKMCIWFGYNPWINFCHFFHFVNFVIFWSQILWKCIDSGYVVSATPYTISCLSLCNFEHLFFHGLKMCMWLDLILQLIFVTLLLCQFSQVRHQLHRSSIYFFSKFLGLKKYDKKKYKQTMHLKKKTIKRAMYFKGFLSLILEEVEWKQ